MSLNPESPATPPEYEKMPEWWKSDFFFLATLTLVTLGLAWGMARLDLDLRARRAFFEGERYYAWYHNPGMKKAYFDSELAAHRVNLDQYQLLMQDSDLKNAYIWYDTVVELLQPPRSVWVVKSEERLKEVKPRYDIWLKSLGISPVD